MDKEEEIKDIEEIKLKEENREKQSCKKQDAFFWYKAGVMAQRFAEDNLSPKKMLRAFNKTWENIMG